MDIIITIIRQNKNTKNNYLNNAQNAENKGKMPVNRQNNKRNFGTGGSRRSCSRCSPFRSFASLVRLHYQSTDHRHEYTNAQCGKLCRIITLRAIKPCTHQERKDDSAHTKILAKLFHIVRFSYSFTRSFI